MKKKYEALFTPAKIGSLEVPNRFVMVPMISTAVLDWTMKGKGYNEEVHDLLINRAKDGVGLIIAGAVSLDSMATGERLALHPEAFDGIKEFTDEIHSYGSKIFFQFTVGVGRNLPIPKMPDGTIPTVGPFADIKRLHPSASAGLPNRWAPEVETRELSVDEIHQMVEDFGEVAALCKANGVDGVDVHAVHEGYLLDQFTMPYTNHRTDEYGGSLENRLRFPCEIVQSIKAKCGDDYPVVLRYSVTSRVRDFGKGIIPADHDSAEIGRTLEESKKAIKILSDAGYDGFDADNGTYDAWYFAHPPVYMPLNCNLEQSKAVKPFTDKPIICAGRMQLDAAAEAIEAGQLDFCGIGRQFLADENYLTKIKEEHEEDIIPCISCHAGCFQMGLWKNSGAVMGNAMGNCALNPYTMHEKKFAVVPTENPKRFAVIGGGIAGMEFALQATKRGHKVTIFEKSDHLGGVFNEASVFSFKEKERALLEYYNTQMKKYDIEVKFNTEVTDLAGLDYDEIIVATGAKCALALPAEGVEHAVNAVDYLAGDFMNCGDDVVIIGGGLTGCEIAYDLAQFGKHPVLVELQDDILKIPGSCMANTSYLRDAFEYYKVPVYTSSKATKINADSVEVVTEDGTVKVLPSDTTIISIGYGAGSPFETEDEHVHVIGDADKVGNLLSVILQANELVLSFK